MDTELLKLKERTSNKLTKDNRVTKEGVMKGVNIIGLIGKSNKAAGATEPYKYKESAIQKAVIDKVYSSVDSFMGHSLDDGSQRNPKDRVGIVMPDSVTYKEGVGAIGDIQLDPKHPHFASIEWWANNYPEKIMLSHEAKLVYSKKENAIVEITSVDSVDFVIDGNTTTALFKEGVIKDAMDASAAERACFDILDTFRTLAYQILYPMYNSYSDSQNKALTQAEKAVLLTPIAQDLVKELKALGTTSKESTTKVNDMDIKTLTLADLIKDRADLVATIGAEAVAKEASINDKVNDAVKDVPADKRSVIFLKQVREAVVKNDTAAVTELVNDRKLILKEATVTTSVKAETDEQLLAKEAAAKGKAVELTDEQVLAALK